MNLTLKLGEVSVREAKSGAQYVVSAEASLVSESGKKVVTIYFGPAYSRYLPVSPALSQEIGELRRLVQKEVKAYLEDGNGV